MKSGAALRSNTRLALLLTLARRDMERRLTCCWNRAEYSVTGSPISLKRRGEVLLVGWTWTLVSDETKLPEEEKEKVHNFHRFTAAAWRPLLDRKFMTHVHDAFRAPQKSDNSYHQTYVCTGSGSCGFLGFRQLVKKLYCNNKTQQNTSRREELFICCETTKHTICFVCFCAGEIFTTLVDSTVSENKIHSFSGLRIKRTGKKAHPNHKSAINTCRLFVVAACKRRPYHQQS